MIKVLIDTNILVSAVLNNCGMPNKDLRKAIEFPHQTVICEQSFPNVAVFVLK